MFHSSIISPGASIDPGMVPKILQLKSITRDYHNDCRYACYLVVDRIFSETLASLSFITVL